MTFTTTFRRLRKAGACTSRYELLRKALSREQYGDDTPINLLTILSINGLDDALWALSATAENCDKIARLMAADFAEQALPIWQKYSGDKRPELAIKAARDFAHGRIDRNQLEAAAWAARAAAWAAWADAGDAAGSAARDAAWAASVAGAASWADARAAQASYLRANCHPNWEIEP